MLVSKSLTKLLGSRPVIGLHWGDNRWVGQWIYHLALSKSMRGILGSSDSSSWPPPGLKSLSQSKIRHCPQPASWPALWVTSCWPPTGFYSLGHSETRHCPWPVLLDYWAIFFWTTGLYSPSQSETRYCLQAATWSPNQQPHIWRNSE